MPTQCEQAAIDLAAAKTALHALATGIKPQSISHADKSISYTPADAESLQQHIRMLQAKVDACNGRRSNRRAFRFIPN